MDWKEGVSPFRVVRWHTQLLLCPESKTRPDHETHGLIHSQT